MFVKPGTPAEHEGPIYIINQNDPASGKFDEHKVVMGAADPQEARDIYHRNYQAGWQGFGSMVAMPLERFKKWAEARKRIAPAGGRAAHETALHVGKAGEEHAAFDAIRHGDALDQVRNALPRDPDMPLPKGVRGTMEEAAATVESWLRTKIAATDPRGRRILIANPEDGTLLDRARHLIGDKDAAGNRILDPDKMATVFATDTTIANPHIIAQQPNPRTGKPDDIYVRRYRDRTLHFVFVEPGGRVVDQMAIQGSLRTQYAPKPHRRFEGAAVTWKRQKPAPGLAPSQEAGLAPAPGPLEESQTVVNPSPQPTPNDNQRGMQGQSLFAPRANPDDGIANPAPFGFNTLDRALSSTVARAVTAARQSPPGQSVENFIAHSYEHTAPGNLVKKTVDFLKGQFVPLSVLPREARALLSEMRIKQAFAQQNAMDITRALSGRAKFSDIAFPARYAGNPAVARQLWEAMDTVNLEEADARAKIAALPTDLQRMATFLRAELVAAGQDATRAGLISWETFERLTGGYLPHYYENDESAGSPIAVLKRFALSLKGVKQQRTTAWHIVDKDSKDDDGLQRALTWDDRGRRWRFRSQEHRDAFYEDYIAERAVEAAHEPNTGTVYTMLKALDRVKRAEAKAELSALDRAQLDRIDQLMPETRRILREVQVKLRTRFQNERPLTIAEKERSGLIMDPVHATARYILQMRHDIATAEFFNAVADNPLWTSNAPAQGMTEIPANRRFGRLAGKHVRADLAEQVLELAAAPDTAVIPPLTPTPTRVRGGCGASGTEAIS